MIDISFGIIPALKTKEGLKFLLVQHKAIEGGGGHWSFPKGHAEEGETEIQAAKRELKEETGLTDIEILGNEAFFEKYKFSAGETEVQKTVKYFLAIAKDTDIKIDEEEIETAKWLDYETAAKQLTFDEGRQLLKEARAYLKQNTA